MPHGNVTQILHQIESGDPSAAAELLPLVYDELRKLASAKLANEKPGQTLEATALVHEAYLRLVGVDHGAKPATLDHAIVRLLFDNPNPSVAVAADRCRANSVLNSSSFARGHGHRASRILEGAVTLAAQNW
jgi:ECF sigma factor